MQHTIAQPAVIGGTGLHSGRTVTMRLLPAAAGAGIVFVRTDLPDGQNEIPARWDLVTDTRLCTLISNRHGARVGTVEHLMSALRGCGIDNLRIEIDGPEVPVMDGSAAPFVDLIDATGLNRQEQPVRVIRVLKDIRVQDGDKSAALTPSDEFAFAGEIEFSHPSIGRQRFSTSLLNGNFRHDIAHARTFGFAHEVEFLRKNGLALGGSLENAIVLDQAGILNPGGLRFADEFIRHKLLDAIGDLYLAGSPILGRYEGNRAGHAINNALLHALFADPAAWVYEEMSTR